MARCAYCNATILFGGRQVGGYQYCNTHHALAGRALQPETQSDLAGLHEQLRELRDDLVSLAEEVQQQRASLSEVAERLDFVERTLVQLRERPTK